MAAQHKRQILRLCLYILRKSPADVDDAMQETFIAAFEGLNAAFQGRGGLRDPNSYDHWLMRIAAFQCCELLRKRSREGRLFALDLDVDHASGSDGAEIESYVETRLLAFCISELPPDRQELFMQWHFDGVSQKEIAAQRGTGVPAASRLLGRLYEKVRECVMGKVKGGDS